MLGYLPGPGQRGIVGHFALAVDESAVPLTVLEIETLTPSQLETAEVRQEARSVRPDQHPEARSSVGQLVQTVRARIDGRTPVIHVMDCEADSFSLVASGQIMPRKPDGFEKIAAMLTSTMRKAA